MQTARRVSELGWTSTHTWIFIGFCLGMLLEAYVYGLPTVASSWVAMPRSNVLEQLLLAWSPIWLVVGIALGGLMADRIGRKSTFAITMSLYAVGALVLVFASAYWLLLAALALMLLAGGGEMNTILAASHELMPRRHRSKALYLEVNSINFGGFVLASIALLTVSQNIGFQRGTIGIAVLASVAVLAIVRTKMPESIHWLERLGRTDDAARETVKHFGSHLPVEAPEPPPTAAKRLSPAVKLPIAVAVSASNTIGFSLMAYVLGPYYFPNLSNWILFAANVAGFGAGFIGLFADRLSRKKLVLWSFLLTFATTVVIMLTRPAWSAHLGLFFLLLVVLNAFISVSYLTEDTLKSEIWPTRVRARYIALVRFIAIGVLNVPSIFFTAHLGIQQYLWYVTVVWGVGAAAAVTWYFIGYETGAGTSIEVASAEA